MNLNFLRTKQLTDDQTRAIDKALLGHNIDVPAGGGYGQFDWLCERIENALVGYIKLKDRRPQSRADVLTDIERLRSAFDRVGGGTMSGAKGILIEAAASTKASELFHHTGLNQDLHDMLDRIMETGEGAYGHIPEKFDNSWLFDYGQVGIQVLAWEMIKEACNLALSEAPPASISSQVQQETPVKNIIEVHTPNAKGGRPKDDDKQQLVRDLASAFSDATGRKATETESGAFDNFLSACLAVVEPAKDTGNTNRKLIRAALNYVPKPRKKN